MVHEQQPNAITTGGVANPDAPLWVNDLTVAYHRKPVLWDIELSLPEGRLIAVVGPNGAGKSTLIKSVLGLVPRASGTVAIYGKSYATQRHLVGRGDRDRTTTRRGASGRTGAPRAPRAPPPRRTLAPQPCRRASRRDVAACG